VTRKRDSGKVAQAVRLYEEGMTRDEVAQALQVRGSTVTRWLGGHARRRGRRKREDVTDDEILALRDADHLSFREIGIATGMSKTGARLRYYALTGRPRPDRPDARAGRDDGGMPAGGPQQDGTR